MNIKRCFLFLLLGCALATLAPADNPSNDGIPYYARAGGNNTPPSNFIGGASAPQAWVEAYVHAGYVVSIRVSPKIDTARLEELSIADGASLEWSGSTDTNMDMTWSKIDNVEEAMSHPRADLLMDTASDPRQDQPLKLVVRSLPEIVEDDSLPIWTWIGTAVDVLVFKGKSKGLQTVVGSETDRQTKSKPQIVYVNRVSYKENESVQHCYHGTSRMVQSFGEAQGEFNGDSFHVNAAAHRHGSDDSDRSLHWYD